MVLFSKCEFFRTPCLILGTKFLGTLHGDIWNTVDHYFVTYCLKDIAKLIIKKLRNMEQEMMSEPETAEDLGRLVVVVVVVGLGSSLQHCFGRVSLTKPLIFWGQQKFPYLMSRQLSSPTQGSSFSWSKYSCWQHTAPLQQARLGPSIKYSFSWKVNFLHF